MKFFPLSLALLFSFGSVQAQDLSKQFPVKDAPRQKGSGAQKKKKKSKYPPQTQFALKTPFPTVGASVLKGAIPATNLVAAKAAVGKNAVVVGTVSQSFVVGGGTIVLLNFAKDYKTAVVGAIKKESFGNFPSLATLTGKKVAISGKVVLYKGHPEVELTARNAIKLVK
ncbi:hypothetical protein EON80_12295 [bacterium]|nr:MAG: hypothetical protein EON80_12295 [bacterium]